MPVNLSDSISDSEVLAAIKAVCSPDFFIKDDGLVVPYTICSDVTAYSAAAGTTAGVKTMCYGDPLFYTLGLFGDYEVSHP